MPTLFTQSPGGEIERSVPPHEREYKRRRVDLKGSGDNAHDVEIVDLTFDEEDERKCASSSTNNPTDFVRQRSLLRSSIKGEYQPIPRERILARINAFKQDPDRKKAPPIQSTRSSWTQRDSKNEFSLTKKSQSKHSKCSIFSRSKVTSTSREVASKPFCSGRPRVISANEDGLDKSKPTASVESHTHSGQSTTLKDPFCEFLKQKSEEEIQKLNEAFEREAMAATEPTAPSWLGGMSIEEVKEKNAAFEAFALSEPLLSNNDQAESSNSEVPGDIREIVLSIEKPANLSDEEFYQWVRVQFVEKPKTVDYPYTWEEYQRDFIELGSKQHFCIEELEQSRGVTKANTTVGTENSREQNKAQYGRTMFQSASRIFEIGGLTASKVFVDIGHGVGNLPFQAAYTIGCESRGIELIRNRCDISDQFHDFYREKHERYCERDRIIRKVGNISLRHGQLEAPEHREFLSKGVDLMFCNNFNDVFGQRSVNAGEVRASIDDYIAGLFTQLKAGAKLITLHALSRLPHPLPDANEAREKNGLEPSERASFYTLDVIDDEGGNDKLSFTTKPFKYYVYTRVGEATLLCGNPACEYAKKAKPIQAFRVVSNKQNLGGENKRDHKDERLITVVDCPKCHHAFRLRRQRAKAIKPYGE